MKAIYKITNTKTGHFYIGSTTDTIRRWKAHRNKLRKGNHENIHLQNAWSKEGEALFDFAVVVSLPDDTSYDTILTEEQKLLDIHCGKEWCYNIASKSRIDSDEVKKILSRKMSGCLNPMFGKTHTAEARKKISEAAKGRKHKPETIEKLKAKLSGKNNPMYGITLPPEQRPMLGKKHKPESIQRMKEGHSKTIRRTRKKYEFFHPELGTHILSKTDFIKQFGLSMTTIYKLAHNRRVIDSKGWKILRTIRLFLQPI